LQEEQQPYSAAVDRINTSEVKYHGSPLSLGERSLSQSVTLGASHDAPYAAYDSHFSQVLDDYTQHDRITWPAENLLPLD